MEKDTGFSGSKNVFNSNPLSLLSDFPEMAQLAYLNFWVSPSDSHDFGNNAPTAILVPGFGCKKGAMSVLGNDLKERMNVVYADDFPAINTCSIRKAAELLAPTVRETLKNRKNEGVFLVGYSNGGLIALLSLHMETRMRVEHVVTMGTPHRGTPRAELVSMVSESCREINVQGGYMKGKNSSSKIGGKMLAMVAKADTIVPHHNQLPHPSSMDRKRVLTATIDAGHFGFIMGDTVKQTAEHINNLVH